MDQIYELDAPLVEVGTEEGGRRYGCCHRDEGSGHGEDCTLELRTRFIEQTLERAGLLFKRKTFEKAPPQRVEVLIRICVDELDRRASLDKQPDVVSEGCGDDDDETRATEPSLAEELTGATRTARFSAAEPNLGNDPTNRAGDDPLMELGGPVNHPRHYNTHPAGIECVDVNEHMTANIAAAVKYVWRAGLKPDESHDKDLAKAVWYIERERSRVRKLADVRA